MYANIIVNLYTLYLLKINNKKVGTSNNRVSGWWTKWVRGKFFWNNRKLNVWHDWLIFKIGVISNWASINIKGSIISNHAKGGIIIKSH